MMIRILAEVRWRPFYPSPLRAEGVLPYRSGWAVGCHTLWNAYISENAGQSYPIQNSMELSRPVVAQRHSSLSPYKLVNGLKKSSNQLPCTGVQTLRDTYLWNRWMDLHRSTYRELSKPAGVQHLGLLTLTLHSQSQMLKTRTTGSGGLLDTERKGYELIGRETHFVALNFDLSHDFDLEISRSNFEKAVFQEL